MNNIKTYKDFILNESRNKFLTSGYKNRVKDYGLSGNSTILQKTENFFQKMEDRINRMAEMGQSYQKQRRSERGTSSFNTGVESLFSLPSVVPNVLKRVFGPTDFGFTKKLASDESVDLDFVRHTNEKFIKNELPKIKTEKQLEDNIEDLYRRGGVRRGQSPALDEIGRNRIATFFEREMNPNQAMFKVTNN
jgi:hypothetical protein